ncbi:MAG: hypothetical protein QNJ72_16595 [Pleurocapsa sp. MO_226.B13]|nr:hypothetical protein [Pleurocapsa sp. MO_226.B13]
MDTTNVSNTWWDNYRETVKITKRFRELVSLVDDREDIAQNLISREKNKYPGKTEIWYLNKLIRERKQTSLINMVYQF